VIAQIRAELLKHHSARSTLWLFAAMIGLVVLVILLHALFLPIPSLGRGANQLEVFGQGQRLGTLFGALLGAMSITAEFRHGTIRPTLLASPRRGRVVMAKVWVSMLIGIAFGFVAAAIAAGVGSAALAARGVDVTLAWGAFALLLGGSAVGAALWAGIGVGLGAVLRNQVSSMVGICTWLLFVEGLLFGDIGLSKIGRFLPGSLAKAATGQDPLTLLAPALSVLLLVLYALAATALGWVTMARRDVA
jgi:ABC-type transport system involved in multi-copper enzyme maturation permease subunit